MALIEARTFTSGADMTAHFKAIRSKLWKATGIYDPNKMTNSQRLAAERKIEREREIAEIKRRQMAIQTKQQEEEDARRLAALAHRITPRVAKSLAGTPKAMLIEMCRNAGVDFFDIVGPSRREEIVAIRHKLIGAMHLKMIEANREFSTNQMGKLFNRDHSSIINSLRRCGVMAGARPLKGPKGAEPRSGVFGVSLSPNGRYRARPSFRGQYYNAGTYDTMELATSAVEVMLNSCRDGTPLSVWEVYRRVGVFK